MGAGASKSLNKKQTSRQAQAILTAFDNSNDIVSLVDETGNVNPDLVKQKFLVAAESVVGKDDDVNVGEAIANLTDAEILQLSHYLNERHKNKTPDKKIFQENDKDLIILDEEEILEDNNNNDHAKDDDNTSLLSYDDIDKDEVEDLEVSVEELAASSDKVNRIKGDTSILTELHDGRGFIIGDDSPASHTTIKSFSSLESPGDIIETITISSRTIETISGKTVSSKNISGKSQPSPFLAEKSSIIKSNDGSPNTKAIRNLVESSQAILWDIGGEDGSPSSLQSDKSDHALFEVERGKKKYIPRSKVYENPSVDGYYQDFGQKIDAKNESLMGLQRQKIWSYAKNAQLEREVELLQKQLLQMEMIDKEKGFNSTFTESSLSSIVKDDKKISSEKTGHNPKKWQAFNVLNNENRNEDNIGSYDARRNKMLALQQEQQQQLNRNSNGNIDRQGETKKGREIKPINLKNSKNDILNHDSSSLFSIDGGSVDDLTDVSYAESAKPSRHNAPLYKVESASNSKPNLIAAGGGKRRVTSDGTNNESQLSARGNGSHEKLMSIDRRKNSPRIRRDRGRESDDDVETMNTGQSNNDRKVRINRVRRDRRESDDEADNTNNNIQSNNNKPREIRGPRRDRGRESDDDADSNIQGFPKNSNKPRVVRGPRRDRGRESDDDVESNTVQSINNNKPREIRGPRRDRGRESDDDIDKNKSSYMSDNDNNRRDRLLHYNTDEEEGYVPSIGNRDKIKQKLVEDDLLSGGGVEIKKEKSKDVLKNLNRKRRHTVDNVVEEQDSMTDGDDYRSGSKPQKKEGDSEVPTIVESPGKNQIVPTRKTKDKDDRKQKFRSRKSLPKDQEAPPPSVEEPEPSNKLWSRALDSRWSEVNLLLRRKIETDEDLQYTIAAAEAGLMFTDQLNITAKSLNVLRGTLSRWLLPYDNNTRIDEQCSTPHSVLENMPESLRGKITERQIHYLVAGANSVRKLVRIKIADDNDLEQARLALKTAIDFFRRLQEDSAKANISPFELFELRDRQ